MSKKKQSTKNTIKSERKVVVETRLLSSKMVRALEDFCETHKIKIPQYDHEFNLLNFLVLITDKANKLSKAAKDVDEAIQKLMSISKNLDEDGVMDYAQECPNCGSDVLIEYSECHVCGENLFTTDITPLSNDDLKFKEEMLKKPASEPKKSEYIEQEMVEMDLDDDDFFEEEEPKKEEPKKKIEPKKEEKPKKASKKVDIEEEEDEDDFFNDFDDEEEEKPAPKKSSKKGVVEEDDFDDFDDEEEEKPAPKKSSKKEVVEVEEDEDEDDSNWEDMLNGFDDDEEEEDEPAPKKSSKKKVVEEEEEDFDDEEDDDFSFDDDEDSDDEEEEDEPAPKQYKPKAVLGDEDDDVLPPTKKKGLTEEEKNKKLNDLLSKVKKNPKALNDLKRTDLTFIGLKLKFNGTLKMKNDELHTAILKHISGK